MHKLKDNSRKILLEYAIPLLAFVIPLHKLLVNPIIAVIIILLILQISKQKLPFKNLLFSFSYFLILVLGLVNTSNLEKGLFELEISVSFLLFPLIFALIGGVSNTVIEKSKNYFVEGTLVGVIACFAISTFQCYQNGFSFNMFMYDNLAHFHHTSYSSVFACLAIIILYQKIYVEFTTFKSILLPLFLISVLSVFTLLLLSKTGLLTLFIIHLIGLYYLSKRIKIGKTKIIIAISLIIFTLLGLSRVQKVKDRLADFNPIHILHPQDGLTSSTTARFTTWETAGQIFIENPVFGVGTGDFYDQARHKYFEKGAVEIANKNLNAHNQYLQILARNGLIGFIIFGFLIVQSFVMIKDSIFYAFMLIILINFSTESMLQIQSGIIFCSFFLFLFRFKKEDSSAPT